MLGMRYYALSPEVPGGLGERSEMIYRPGTYALVKRLHFEFGADTLGNDLMESHPVYLVTTALADALRASTLTGFALEADIEVTVDENVQEGLEPDWPVPDIEWLQVSGVAGSADFGTNEPSTRLVVSEEALALLRQFKIDDCEIDPIEA